jgi:hypothetical protein
MRADSGTFPRELLPLCSSPVQLVLIACSPLLHPCTYVCVHTHKVSILSGEKYIHLHTFAQTQSVFSGELIHALIHVCLHTVGILSGATTELIAGAVGADCIWTFAAFLGSVSVVEEVKWLWFFIMIGALVVVGHHLVVLFKASAEAKGGDHAQLYSKVI